MQMSEKIVAGALAGLAGTAVMTALMRGMGPKMVPQDMRPAEFLPKSVVEATEKQLGHPNALEGHEMQAGYAAHFAYGAGLGMLYGLARTRLPNVPGPALGALYGLGIWAINFEGVLPALGVQPAATEQPVKKRPMPMMAHLAFGAATALAYDKLSSRHAERVPNLYSDEHGSNYERMSL